MVLCMIVGCSNKSGRHKVSFYRVPTVVKNQGEFMEELTAERRRKWISAVSREDLTDKILENDKSMWRTLRFWEASSQLG